MRFGTIVLVVAALGQCSSESDEVSVTTHQIEHSFSATENGERVWAPCCTLNHQRPKPAKGSPLEVMSRSMDSETMQQLVNLADQGGDYQLRVRSSDNKPYVVGFASACALLASGLKEEWQVTLDQFDNVIALNMSPARHDCSRLNMAQWRQDASQSHEISTTAKLAHAWRGIRPETSTVANKPFTNRQSQPGAPGSTAGEPHGGGEEPEPQSFLQRYWIYLIIPVVYLMVSSLPQEEAQGRTKAAKQS